MQGRKPKFSNSLILDNIYISKKKNHGQFRDSFIIPKSSFYGGGFISHSRSYKAHYSLLFHAACLACCS